MTVINLKIDTDTGDLCLDGSKIAVAEDLDGIRQSVMQRLRFWSGENFMDEEDGTPYLSEILIKNPSLPAIREAFRARIMGVRGVASVDELRLDFDKTTRILSVDFTCTTDLGVFATSLELAA